MHGSDGDSSTVYGNGAAWLAAPITERPVTVQALTGGDLQAARIEAELTFPARIKQSFPTWRAGLPSTIDDRDVQVVQGSGPGRGMATFYFDKESGLLTRLVRYADSVVGRIPMQTDYSDYRGGRQGVKNCRFKWTINVAGRAIDVRVDGSPGERAGRGVEVREAGAEKVE